MPLNLAAVVPQLRALSDALAEPLPDDAGALAEALAALNAWSACLEEIWLAIGNSHASWLCAEPAEPLATVHPLPECPADLMVLGSDGGQIEPDPHAPLLFYVLNVGLAAIGYGREPEAVLRSETHLAHREDEILTPVNGQRLLVAGDVLAVRRGARELRGLAALARAQRDRGRWPLVALRDGNLIEWSLQWSLEGGEDPATRAELYRPFEEALDDLRQIGVPVASYVSRPRSTYLVNTLRVVLCDRPLDDCRRLCNTARLDRDPAAPACSRLRGLTDRQLFEALPLPAGARSASFRRAGKGAWGQVEPAASVRFCYVNTGAEIARIELPDWVAEDPSALDLVHAAVVDQCRRGDGYPPVLTEAHEQAVVLHHDREALDQLLAAELARLGLTPRPSEKATSKRRRAL